MRTTDPVKAAKDFVEKVVVPRRARPIDDSEAVRARDKLAREDVELARRELVEVGFDPKRLDKLVKERSKKHNKLAEDTRRKAIAGSAAAADRLRDRAPVILPIDPIDTIIDQVSFIRTFSGQGRLHSWNVAPSDNWAKYRLQSPSNEWDGIGRLSFFTIWQNKQTSPTIIMARPSLTINAELSVGANANGVGSWVGFSSEASGTVRVRTTVWSIDSGVSTVVHDQVVGEATATGAFFGSSDSASIEFAEFLPALGVAVAAQAYALIEVELRTDWVSRHGSIDLDAETESFLVHLPTIVLTEMRSPPISLTAAVDYGTSPATVTLLFGGATSAFVDIYQDGTRLGDTENDGIWSRQLGPGTYQFRVCERLTSVCSADVGVTVTQ